MRAWLVLSAIFSFAIPAQAQQIYKVAPTGKPIVLGFVYNTAPDCTGQGYAEVRITRQPENGRVSVKKTTGFPTFPASNIRHACNARRVPGIEIRYTSRPGFIGIDYVAVEAIYPQGSSISRSHAITVK